MNSRTFLPLALVGWLATALSARPALAADGDIGGTVADSATGTPLPGGEVRVIRAGNTVATTTTDAFGRYVIHNLPAGSYSVEVRYLGYRPEARDIAVAQTEGVARADFRLVPLPINLSGGRGSAPGAPASRATSPWRSPRASPGPTSAWCRSRSTCRRSRSARPCRSRSTRARATRSSSRTTIMGPLPTP